MEYQTGLKKQRNGEKSRMKKRLTEWGGILELCNRKQEELRRLEKLQRQQQELFGQEEEMDAAAMQGASAGYRETIRQIQGEIAMLLRRRAEMDRLLQRLAWEEQNFVILRYEKGYGFDYIAIKMHMSRATLFRLQERILQRLLAEEMGAAGEIA